MIYTLAQINPTVGALQCNADKMLKVWREAEDGLVIFPELSLCGYPPEDLILKPSFLDGIERHVNELAQHSAPFAPAALISVPWRIDGGVYNAALLIDRGQIIAVQAKHHLPNYSVFDEQRIFIAGALPTPIEFRGAKLGVLICEDMWFTDVAAHLKAQGAEILIAVNASPYHRTKHNLRLNHAHKRVQETSLPLISVNQIGGQDEIVFDGASFIMNAQGDVTHQLDAFKEDVQGIDPTISAPITLSALCEEGSVYSALTLGLRDYVLKNNFPGVLIGLSGGVDSALAAVLAVDALGADKVHCVMMPSPYTSQDSLDDAAELAENLGCTYETISIKGVMQAFESTIDDLSGTAHENMQSRARGLILMSMSNMNGKMVVSTGNKSEMAVGYATLYGDMCGGFNPLKDLYKTSVYDVCAWRNTQSPTIPERILTKAPSAELKDNQCDQDSLPDYDTLDAILECLIEGRLSVEETAARGYDAQLVARIYKMLKNAEYKRRQAPPGVVITTCAFGRDRRMPITNHHRS